MTTAANALVEHDGSEIDVPRIEPGASESAAIFSIIERAARDPNVDIDKMQRLMDMREKEMARIAQKSFNEAMKAAQADMPQVVRDADNDQTRSKYARYETISEAIQPIITRHGFSLSFGEGKPEKDNCIRITCEVMHDAGHSKQYWADVPFDNVGMKGNANKTNTHAYGSTKSYGKRYLKCDIFDVAVKNADDDGNKSGTASVTEEQLMQLRELITEIGADEAKVCGAYRIESLSELPAKMFADAVQALKDWARNRK